MFGWAFVADDCKGTNLEMFKRTNELTYDIADSQGRLELETISSDVPVFAFRAAGVASVA